MRIYKGLKRYFVSDNHDKFKEYIWISKDIYKKFEEEINAIITYFKLIDYNFRITNVEYYVIYRFNHATLNKGCIIKFNLDKNRILKNVQVGIGTICRKDHININREENVIESLKIMKEHICKIT